MKILIAFDGSGNSHNSLDDLLLSGLPQNAEVFIISVSESWLSLKTNQISDGTTFDSDISEYFQKHSEQMNRNLAETKLILLDAAKKLHSNFPDWTIKTEAVSGSAASQILSKALSFKPDLIVIGEQGLSWDNTQRLGAVSNKVLTGAKSSVRIAKSKNEPDTNLVKIAVCFDGSPGAIKAVKAVASRNWRQKIEIRLITVTDLFVALIPGRVFQVIPGMPEGKMIGEKKFVESLAEDARQILRNADYSSELHIYSGNPRIVLINEITKWGADLIFIGANSSQMRNPAPGSVAWAVAARAYCTVEVIHG